MSILVDIKAALDILKDAEAIESGPVAVSVSGPIRIVLTAANGKVMLDTTVQVNLPAAPA